MKEKKELVCSHAVVEHGATFNTGFLIETRGTGKSHLEQVISNVPQAIPLLTFYQYEPHRNWLLDVFPAPALSLPSFVQMLWKTSLISDNSYIVQTVKVHELTVLLCSVVQLIDHPPRTVQTPTMRSGGYGSIGRSSPKVRPFPH